MVIFLISFGTKRSLVAPKMKKWPVHNTLVVLFLNFYFEFLSKYLTLNILKKAWPPFYILIEKSGKFSKVTLYNLVVYKWNWVFILCRWSKEDRPFGFPWWSKRETSVIQSELTGRRFIWYYSGRLCLCISYSLPFSQ